MVDSGSRILNSKRNILFDLAHFVVSQGLPFVVRTVLIQRFGVEYLGLNSLFASILGVLSLMDLGFGVAVTFSLYKPAAEGDFDLICAYLAYYRRVYRLVGMAILAVGLAIMPCLQWLVRDPSLPGGLNLYVCWLIFLSNASISYLLYGYMEVVPTAFQRKDVLSRVGIGMSLLGCVAQILALMLGRSFYVYLLAMPALTIVRNLAVAAVVRRKYPEIDCRGDIGSLQRDDLRKRLFGILINRITNVSRNGIDSLCISAFLGLSMTGIYSNYYYVMSGVLTLGIMVCRSVLPSVGNSVVTEEADKNYADMRVFDFAFMIFVGWASACMLCLYQPFMRLWVGEKDMFGLPVVVGFCAYYYILEAGAIQWLYHQGAGLWWECRFAMIAEAVANVVLNVALCGTLGVMGVVLATVLTVAVTNFILFPWVLFARYFRNGRLGEYLCDHAAYMMVAIVCSTLCWVICTRLVPESMVAGRGAVGGIVCLGGRLAICTAISVLFNWLVWHRSERFSQMVVLVKRTVAAR